MTQYESNLFSELLDVNYELETGEHNSVVMASLLNRYSQIVEQLEESMGKSNWRNFIGKGKQMFGEELSYGDEPQSEVLRMLNEVYGS